MSIKKIANNLEVVSNSMMDNNSYLLYKNNEVIIIDPSFNGGEIIRHLNDKKEVAAIFLTHAHFDHTFDTKKLADKFKCPVYFLDKEKETYQLYDCSNWFDNEVPDFKSHISYIKEGNFKVRDFNLKIYHTPGHTAGGMTIVYDNYAFTGDTLFYDSYGRTDLYNSSQIKMKESLKFLFKTLSDNQLILPGHGKWATLKEVKEVNLISLQIMKK